MSHILRTKIIDGKPCVILQPARPVEPLQGIDGTTRMLMQVERMIERGEYQEALSMVRERLGWPETSR